MNETISEQVRLIGEHPKKEVFAEWIKHEDLPAFSNKRHRKLIEVDGMREYAIEYISDWIVKHHVKDETLIRLKRKRNKIIEKYGLNQYLEQQEMLPRVEKTMRGNCGEIILAEYLKASSELNLLLFKLRYNPNVNQSMKGDDVLLFDKDNLMNKIIVGESKFRKVPGQAVIKEITDEFGKKVKFPLSILFVANILSELGEEDLADELEELNIEVKKGRVPVVNVGFLLSNHNSASNVEKHLESDNESFIFVSLGINQPEELVSRSFQLANEKLMRSIENEN